MTPTSARVIYPELPDPLTPGDLQQLFSPSFDERQWAPTVVRAAASQVALLVHLKIFQSIGRFRPAAEIPAILMEHVARRMGVEIELCQSFPERTRYRHRQAIFKRLGVVSWGPEALALTKATMRMTAIFRNRANVWAMTSASGHSRRLKLSVVEARWRRLHRRGLQTARPRCRGPSPFDPSSRLRSSACCWGSVGVSESLEAAQQMWHERHN